MVAIELVVYGVVFFDNTGRLVYQILKVRPDATVGDYLREHGIFGDYLEEFRGTTATLANAELRELIVN